MTFTWDPSHRQFAEEHVWGVLATGRGDGSPQQSLVGYLVDPEGRIVVSTKTFTAKWRNAHRRPRVSLCIAAGRIHLVVYGEAELLTDDPERAELSADLFARLSGDSRPNPAAIIPVLVEQHRGIVRITPTSTVFHD